MYKILVTTDGSEQSIKTIEEAVKIALPLKAEITVLSVVEDVNSMIYASNIPKEVLDKVKKDQTSYYNEIAEKAKKMVEEKGVKVTSLVKKGYPVDVICDIAEKGKYDLVVVGRRRLGKLQGFILGSVSNKVVQYAKTSVLVIK